MHKTASFRFVLALLLVTPSALLAQGGRGGGGQRGPGGPPPAQSAKAAAPVDLSGYWVSIVTEDWIERMSPDSPPSGTGGARGLTRAPAVAPPPNGEQCRVYAAGGSLRVPTRLNITWVDDNTLKVQMDAGNQTRLFHFMPETPRPAEKNTSRLFRGDLGAQRRRSWRARWSSSSRPGSRSSTCTSMGQHECRYDKSERRVSAFEPFALQRKCRAH